MDAPLIIQDSSVLLNLMATNRLDEIMRGVGRQTMVCREVTVELLYLRDFVTGERVAVDLAAFVTAGVIIETDFNSPQEIERFVEFAATLDDGEAASAAIAEIRHLELSTDERKATNLLLARGMILKLWTTPDLIFAWANNAHPPKADVREAITRIQKCARYSPPTAHPLKEWWGSILQSTD
jgi:hypothetical protein